MTKDRTEGPKADERPFEFQSARRQPTGPLGKLVESVWYARGTVPYEREKIAPTGSSVAVVVLGDPIVETPDDGAGTPLRSERGFLVGPHDRPVINEPTGETYAVGIVATPIGCRAVFGLPPAEIRGKVVQLESVWAPAADLRRRLAALEHPESMLDLIVEVLNVESDLSGAGLDYVSAALELLDTNPAMPVADVADRVGISHGHLNREFTRVVGLTPRAVTRLLRLQHMLGELDVERRIVWTDLAAELGWFDQAHFIRDFKRHTGVTPSEYLAAQRRNYPGADVGEAAGFVPEGTR